MGDFTSSQLGDDLKTEEERLNRAGFVMSGRQMLWMIYDFYARDDEFVNFDDIRREVPA